MKGKGPAVAYEKINYSRLCKTVEVYEEALQAYKKNSGQPKAVLNLMRTGVMKWEDVLLGDIVTLKRGFDLPASKRQEGAVPIFSSSGLTGYHNEAKLKGPGVITGRYGTIGQVFYTAKEYWPLNTTLYVEDFKGNNEKFIYYLLSFLDFTKFSDKSAVPGINRNHVHIYAVRKPPLPVQKGIAATLSCLDDKIELNNRINANLEAQAQAIFKSWFVDFEPFQDGEFVDSELGRIPKGWKIDRFTDCVSVLGGGTPKTDKAEYWNGDIPFFTPKDVSGTYALETEKHLSSQGLSNCNSQLYPVNTVFITARGTVGKIALAAADMAMNQSCYALVGKAGYSQLFIYGLAQMMINSLKHKSNGAVFNAIVTRDFDSEYVAIPAREVVAEYHAIVAPMFATMLGNSKQNRALAAIRDALLPKLMSDEIDVPMEI